MLEPAQYVLMRLPHFEQARKGLVPYLVIVSFMFSYLAGYVDGYQQVPQKGIILPKNSTLLGTEDGQSGVVASKSGTTFYYPWCSGRNRIKPENERWFSSPSEAQKYGLKPAKNCLGL